MSEDLIKKAKQAYEKSKIDSEEYWRKLELETFNKAFEYFKNIFPEIEPLSEKNKFKLLDIEFNYEIGGISFNLKSGASQPTYCLKLSRYYDYYRINSLSSLGEFLSSNDYLEIKSGQNNTPISSGKITKNKLPLFERVKLLFK